MTFDSMDAARQAAVNLFQVFGNPVASSNWKFHDLLKASQNFWHLGYEHAAEDIPAFQLMLENLAKMAKRDPMLTILASNFALLPSEQIFYFWMARWADQGYPVIEIGHRLAASLMATSVQDTAQVIPPWKAFGIKVPEGLMSLADGQGQYHPVVKLMAQTLVTEDGRQVWNYMIQTDTGLTLWRHGVDHKFIAQMEKEDGIQWGVDKDYALAIPATEHDDRVNVLAVRLLLGVCLTMSDQSAVENRSAKGNRSKKRGSNDPNVTLYRLCRPVSVDVRDAIRDYLEGRGGGVPTVRSLVRGHWKRQACGPQHSERKWIHVEPYWRGPDGAPVAVRDHRIGDH